MDWSKMTKEIIEEWPAILAGLAVVSVMLSILKKNSMMRECSGCKKISVPKRRKRQGRFGTPEIIEYCGHCLKISTVTVPFPKGGSS